MADSVRENLSKVHDRIAAVCLRASRSASEVRLVAVSKTKSIEMVREAYAAGQSLFGENYVQEAVDKMTLLPEAEWHFIGSLQTNKAKQVAGRFALIHSVDRVKLAVALNSALENATLEQNNVKHEHERERERIRVKHPQRILLQVHLGDESTKHGFSLAELPQAAREIAQLPNLAITGLMSLPPLEDSEEKSRAHFARLREALDTLRASLPEAQRSLVRELSMGTSGDLEAAILEGATYVRVGTDIFGARR